jgi:glycosyltransferase involved in cell wall biosynthesis
LVPRHVVYDITDDYSHFVNDPRRKAVVRRREETLLQRADLVFVTNPSLREPRLPLNPNVHVSLNGVDYELFATAADPSLPEHPLLEAVPKPRIGFVGFVSDWLDFELVSKMAERWPGRVVMVGPIKAGCQAASERISKAIWTGFIKDRAGLPALIRGFDVVTMPFLKNELTDNMNPLKIWEYLATGKPFVSTALESMRLCAGLGESARSHAEFLELVERGLLEGQAKAPARMALAREHSWDTIFDEMMQKLVKLLPSREAACKSPSLD